MIINRISSAIKRQDLSQIIIEILIVVIGIFLGLQVTDWNEGRQDRIQEKKYLNRFHVEIIEALKPAQGLLISNELRHKDITDIAKIINGDIKADGISKSQCHSLHMAGIFSSQATALPTMNELSSTGRLSIIQNEDIRTAMSKYQVNVGTWDGVTVSLRADHVSFSDKYPEMIVLDLALANQTFTISNRNNSLFNHVCDLNLMKQNTRFKNDLTKMANKMDAFMVIFLASQVEQLNSLHEILDQELSITHPEQTP